MGRPPSPLHSLGSPPSPQPYPPTPLSHTEVTVGGLVTSCTHTHAVTHTLTRTHTREPPRVPPPSHLVCNTCESRSQPANGSAPEEFPDDPSRAPIGWPPGGVVVAQFIHKADRGNHWALTAGATTGRMEGVGSVRPAKGWKVSKGKNMNGDSLCEQSSLVWQAATGRHTPSPHLTSPSARRVVRHRVRQKVAERSRRVTTPPHTHPARKYAEVGEIV